MIQELPMGGFKWVPGAIMSEIERKLQSSTFKYYNESFTGYKVIVNVSYPEDVQEQHLSFPLLPSNL